MLGSESLFKKEEAHCAKAKEHCVTILILNYFKENYKDLKKMMNLDRIYQDFE